MPVVLNQFTESFQYRFHQYWGHLNNPHVRTLAWLLDSPELLDPNAPQWAGRIATIGEMDDRTRNWLNSLDHNPVALHAHLGTYPVNRLGKYAEKLMAFYFYHQGILVAHGLQVRSEQHGTVGEFDFLLRKDNVLVHWEFATKLYLYHSEGSYPQTDCYIGPNLADTLGKKIRKIMERQLSLAQHPAARAQLMEPVNLAQALVKGWLFYRRQTLLPTQSLDASPGHCRGFWCVLEELDITLAEHYVVLSKSDWLAPVRFKAGHPVMNGQDLRLTLEQYFKHNLSPVLVACLVLQGNTLFEVDRGFVVGNDWLKQAEAAKLHTA